MCSFDPGKELCSQCSKPFGLRLSRRKGFVDDIRRCLAKTEWVRDTSYNSGDEVLELTIRGIKYKATGVNKNDYENFQSLKRNQGRALQYLKDQAPRITVEKKEENNPEVVLSRKQGE